MASNDRAPVQGIATDNEKEDITGGNHVERVETHDNDISLAKIEVDAKLDEFGARSKTNPAEIALVKKLDRTILVSPWKSQDHILIADSNVNSLNFGSCICKSSGRLTSPTEDTLIDMYCSFNFLDRNALVNAKLNSLDEDLGLRGTQYNTLISILFAGYIAGQIPSNMILNRVRPSLYMGGKSYPRFHSTRAKLQQASAWHGPLSVSLRSWPTTSEAC